MARVYSILSRVPSLRIQPRPVGDWGVDQVRPQVGDTCAVHIYLNGDEVRPDLADGQMLDLSTLVPTRLLDGLELYFGPGGPTYEEDGCGALLLWSEALRSREDRPFKGSLRGMVRSRAEDTVTEVELEPIHQVRKPSGVGLFRFDSLPPGAYRVVFAGPDGPIARQDVRIYAHQESTVELSVVSKERGAGRTRPRYRDGLVPRSSREGPERADGGTFAARRTVAYRAAGSVGNGSRAREVP
jgi:hypothetical protein